MAVSKTKKFSDIRNLDWGLDHFNQKRIYYQWIRPSLEYAPAILALANPRFLNKLDSIHAKALKTAMRTRNQSCNTAVYAIAETTPPSTRRLKLAVNIIIKIMKGSLPLSFGKDGKDKTLFTISLLLLPSWNRISLKINIISNPPGISKDGSLMNRK